MNEYGFFTHEAVSYQERVHHVQLAYASYAALLALFEIASLLGEKDDLHVRVVQSGTVVSNHKKIVREALRFLHHILPSVAYFYTVFTSYGLA
jgi:hypothetical protein